MEMLGAIFTVGIVVTGAFMIWLRTKSGKGNGLLICDMEYL